MKITNASLIQKLQLFIKSLKAKKLNKKPQRLDKILSNITQGVTADTKEKQEKL